MRLRSVPPRRTPSLLRDSRGATITEYAIILFLVAVVAATGFRLLGHTIASKMGKASNNLEAQNDSTAQGAAPAATGAAGGHGPAGAAADVKTNPDNGFGGPRVSEAPKEESSLGKFAMIALGIIGCGAAFFAMMKGKNAR